MQNNLLNILKGLMRGTRAITLQSYTEANVKNGLQFELSHYEDSLVGGGSFDIALTTGNKPIIVKAMDLSASGEGLRMQTFKSPAFSGGTPKSVYNLNAGNSSIPTQSSVVLNPSVTSTGTKMSADIYSLGGNTGFGGFGGGAASTTGLEKIIPANTSILIRLTNINGTPERAFTYMTWYEGETDLPRKSL